MPPSRLEMLKGFIAQRPEDPFPRYALAQELKNTGDLPAAKEAFQQLMNAHPNYIPAYFHGGGVLVALGLKQEARRVFERGIELCQQAGDAKTGGELASALAELA